MNRERLGSRLGFILLSAGCAIGIGNVWKFPYMVGQYGGGAFVLVYLFFLAILGIPVMTMEFSLGRASRKSPVRLFDPLTKEGSKWKIHGYVSMIGSYVIMMFYTTVTAWMLRYFVKMATGEFVGTDKPQIDKIYTNMKLDSATTIIFIAIVVVIGFAVCAIGLQNGIEKVTKYMMIALLIIMVALAVNSIFVEGGKQGLAFYLIPDFKRMAEIGIVEVIVGAMNQAFFTLSLGMGSMAIFGSYIGKERALMGEAVNVAVLDTFVAITSGLIIFPACFSYGVEPDAGPDLIFRTLPHVFNNIPLGRLWGSLFFIFLVFAALSTVFAMFESIISCTRDLTYWSRKKACIINTVIVFILSVPCALGFNELKDIVVAGKNIMDMEDYAVSNWILPLGSIVFILCCTTRYGWGWKNFITEANTGKGIKVANWMKFYMTYILPILVLFIFIMGII